MELSEADIVELPEADVVELPDADIVELPEAGVVELPEEAVELIEAATSGEPVSVPVDAPPGAKGEDVDLSLRDFCDTGALLKIEITEDQDEGQKVGFNMIISRYLARCYTGCGG